MDPRSQFPDVADADNPLVWCERCQGHHRQYTFTRADYDRVIAEQVKALSDAIDARIVRELLKPTKPSSAPYAGA